MTLGRGERGSDGVRISLGELGPLLEADEIKGKTDFVTVPFLSTAACRSALWRSTRSGFVLEDVGGEESWSFILFWVTNLGTRFCCVSMVFVGGLERSGCSSGC